MRQLLVLLVLALSCTVAAAATYYVDETDDDCDDTAAGTSQATPWCTVVHAYDTVVAGDTVYVKGPARYCDGVCSNCALHGDDDCTDEIDGGWPGLVAPAGTSLAPIVFDFNSYGAVTIDGSMEANDYVTLRGFIQVTPECPKSCSLSRFPPCQHP